MKGVTLLKGLALNGLGLEKYVAKNNYLFCDPHIQSLPGLKYVHEITTKANPLPQPIVGGTWHSDHLFSMNNVTYTHVSCIRTDEQSMYETQFISRHHLARKLQSCWPGDLNEIDIILSSRLYPMLLSMAGVKDQNKAPIIEGRMKLIYYDVNGNANLMYDPLRTENIVSVNYSEHQLIILESHIKQLISDSSSEFSVILHADDYLCWDNSLVLHRTHHHRPLIYNRVLHRVLAVSAYDE